MDKDFYNKVSIAYQNLSNRFHSPDKRYNDCFVEYDIKLYLFANEKLDFYKQFQEIPFSTFYSNDIVSKFHNKSYYESNCIIIEEGTVKVHIEFYMVLFYFLINEFKVGIRQFIDILNSKELNEYFKHRIKNDDNLFTYNNTINDDILSYFQEKIENFGFIFHLFARTNSNIIYLNIDGKIEINKGLINQFLNTNETVFNYEKFKIQDKTIEI